MSTETKVTHTPGPWRVIASRVDAYTYYFGAEMESQLHMDQREANTRLIAAAPDLLENLESVVDYAEASGSTASWIPAAKATIKKAKRE